MSHKLRIEDNIPLLAPSLCYLISGSNDRIEYLPPGAVRCATSVRSVAYIYIYKYLVSILCQDEVSQDAHCSSLDILCHFVIIP